MSDINDGAAASCAEETDLPAWVVGPDGCKLTLADLPCPGAIRWTSLRKAEVLAAINGGLISTDEACVRFSLSLEEHAAWEACATRWGLNALRITKTQQYRDEFATEQRLGC